MSLLPPKKDVALALLERASVFVHLDPRADDVSVPPWLKRQPQLVLQIGLNLAVNIPDLSVEDEGVSCTLSFSRRPHLCRVPWNAVYALVGEDGRGMVWPSDIPAEVAAQTQAGQRLGPADAGPQRKATPRASRGQVAATRKGDRPLQQQAQQLADAALPALGPSFGPSLGARPAKRPSLIALEGEKPRDSVPALPRASGERSHLRLIK